MIQVGIKQIKPQEEEKPSNNDDNEETMKTINSVMENTSNKDTLVYTQTLTPKERIKLKKEE